MIKRLFFLIHKAVYDGLSICNGQADPDQVREFLNRFDSILNDDFVPTATMIWTASFFTDFVISYFAPFDCSDRPLP